MEIAAAHGVPLSVPPLPSQSPRKHWRPVSEHSSQGFASQVQQGRELADHVDFCSISIDETLDNNNLQQQLYTVARQREDLQRLQIELRARIIARSGLMEMQKTFGDQFEEHTNAYAKLQEQLHRMEQAVHELEKRIEEKDTELHAAWAKEGLLREQNKELQTYRREHDNSEAERSQLLKQIHDLQEHIQDRERQLLELQEQHRVAQEGIMYKDEQLREAQAWIARAQEMDALQSTTNHNLQAELRQRTEQYNQLWLACQQQFAEVERLHLHTVQQLQLELADARERKGICADELRVFQAKSNDSSQFAQNGKKLEANGSVTSTGNSGALPNGNVENLSSNLSTGNVPTQADHVHGVAIALPTLLGMPSHLPPAQVAALHPLFVHQQGVPNSAPAIVSQSHVGQFQSVPVNSAFQHWQNQQSSSECSQFPTISQHPQYQTFNHEAPVNGQAVNPDYLEVHFRQGSENNTMNPSSADLGQVDKTCRVSPPSQEGLQHISSEFHDALRLDALPQKTEVEKKTIADLPNHVLESQGSASEQPCSSVYSSSVAAVPCASINETTVKNASGVTSSEVFVSSGQKNMLNSGKSSDTALLDERSLLACIVRTIPPGSGGKIRISSALPNRLGKMLAPLHWHDYERKYGKLEDFVAGHPELFLIEGDHIQLRDGALEIIAATAAVAKVAAAAKTASSPCSSMLPSIAVTPMAQSYRLKRNPSIDSNHSHHSVENQLANGNTNVKILNKTKDTKHLNSGESWHGLSFVVTSSNSDRSGFGNFVSKESSHGSSGANSLGKQQDRRTGVAWNSRR